MNECLNGPPAELSPTDVDDMNFDSLREQSEKLNIANAEESNPNPTRAGVKGSVGAKKVRKVIGGGAQMK